MGFLAGSLRTRPHARGIRQAPRAISRRLYQTLDIAKVLPLALA